MLDVARLDLVEAIHGRPEALQMLGLAAGGDGGERAAVKGAGEGDEAIALGRAVRRVVAPRRLDRAFHRFGAGIGEEHAIGEGDGAQPLRQPLLAGNAVQIGDVPELLGLGGERLDELGMGVTERGHRDARAEIEIALAFGCEQVGALAPLENEIAAGIGRKESRHGCGCLKTKLPPGAAAAGDSKH